METRESTEGITAKPIAVDGTDGQRPLASPRRAPSGPARIKRAWHLDPADIWMALTSLAMSFGLMAALVLLLAPGAAVLAMVAFWHSGILLYWPTSLAASLGTSVALLMALWIFCGFSGKRCLVLFTVLAICAVIGFVMFWDWDAQVFAVLVKHLAQ